MGTVFKMKAAIVLVPISVLDGWRVFLCNHCPPQHHSHAVVYTAELWVCANWEHNVLDWPQGPASTVPVTPCAGTRAWTAPLRNLLPSDHCRHSWDAHGLHCPKAQ